MAESPEVRRLLIDNDFTYYSANPYTSQPAFVKPVGSLRVKARIYRQCSVVVETWANNFYVVKICGYYRLKSHQITREVLGSVDQMVDRYVSVDEQHLILNGRVRWAALLAQE